MFPADFLPQLSERLILRRFIAQDLERFVGYRQDPRISRFQGWSQFSNEDGQSFINEMQIAKIGIPGEWFQIAIAHKESNQLIGDIGVLIYEDDPTTIEIGFTLSYGDQKKGYAREALITLTKSLFKLSSIKKIVAVTDIRNERSVNLLRYLGMQLSYEQKTIFKGESCIEQVFKLENPG
ncbi:GNAT family N-acetyltransferase [Synechococcus elongatus IITB4]|uniref:GNAT family N-acetyltransferase n=1 Tax=Synechococcus elongatus TaxID=32046 RepID=UPI0030D0AAED